MTGDDDGRSPNVFSIEDYRRTREGYVSGVARCLHCSNEWEATSSSLTAFTLECPRCGLYRGVMKASVQREGPHLVCNCGGVFFANSEDHGWYCIYCGLDPLTGDMGE